MTIQESAEMYLETILKLSLSRPIVRSIDVAHDMGFSKPSVSRAIKNLKENGYIAVDADTGSLTLLPEGERIAKTIYERHTVLTEYLERIGVDPVTAQEDACRIEHVISDESFRAIQHHVDRILKDMDKAAHQ